MIQPIIFAFDSAVNHSPYNHKPGEGILVETSPNQSSLSLMAKLLGYTHEEFEQEYPLLASKFKEEA